MVGVRRGERPPLAPEGAPQGAHRGARVDSPQRVGAAGGDEDEGRVVALAGVAAAVRRVPGAQAPAALQAPAQEPAADQVRLPQRRAHPRLGLAQADAADRGGGHAAVRAQAPHRAPSQRRVRGALLGPLSAVGIDRHLVMRDEAAGTRTEVAAVLRRKAGNLGGIEGLAVEREALHIRAAVPCGLVEEVVAHPLVDDRARV